MVKEPWTGYFPSFRIWGNLYFTGTSPASTHIIDTGDGLIMLDTGYMQSLYLVVDGMHRLGFDPRSIQYIILTHGHIDHFGAAKALKEMSGAKIFLGAPDADCAAGKRDLSYAKELDMEFTETFEPDVLVNDGDTITLGTTQITAVATPGHTEGAMSYFFDVTDGQRTLRAGLHGGMGINTLSREYFTKYSLPFSLREVFVRSMKRLNEEHVDIFLGNHIQHNDTQGKYRRLLAGERNAFVDPSEWEPYNRWCIDNLNRMIQEEDQQ